MRSHAIYLLQGTAAALLLLLGACSTRDPGVDPGQQSGGTSDAGSGAGGAGGGAGGAGGAGGGSATTPSVTSTNPPNGATGVALNTSISATFNEAMDPATLTGNTFTVTNGPTAISVPGTVLYSSSTVTFWPAALLANNAVYTATVLTGAKSSSGLALAANRSWTFTSGSAVGAVLPVNLGTAGGFAILSKSGISTVPASSVTGNIGVSPVTATAITGFSLTADATNMFSRSTQVIGKVYASNYFPPTPANLTTAISDMQLAFTDAAGRAPNVTELSAGNIGGKTLTGGVYKWGSGVIIPSDLTLTGSATDVWIFEIAQGLTVSSAVKVVLANGALAKNIFWQVSGAVDLGTTSHLEGNVLSQTAITLRTGASIKGRLLAQTAVALDSNTVVQPAP